MFLTTDRMNPEALERTGKSQLRPVNRLDADCNVPRSLCFDVKLHAKVGGKEKTCASLLVPSWVFQVTNQARVFVPAFFSSKVRINDQLKRRRQVLIWSELDTPYISSGYYKALEVIVVSKGCPAISTRVTTMHQVLLLDSGPKKYPANTSITASIIMLISWVSHAEPG